MFEVLRIVQAAPHLAASPRAEVERAIREATDALAPARALLEPTLPGVWNGGDWLWRLGFACESEARAAVASDVWRQRVAPLFADRSRIAHFEHVAFERGASGGASPKSGVYRVALFCANRRPTPERLARFAAETAAMPRHVGAIRAHAFSTAVEATGARPWTHVWEQEYDDLGGLLGPYMLHPCHWSQVDRWFDPEDPDWLVDTHLCHTFCATSSPVLA